MNNKMFTLFNKFGFKKNIYTKFKFVQFLGRPQLFTYLYG